MDKEQTLTILLVEDEKPNRSAVKRLLRRQGYRFLEADNGQQGLEIVVNESIDLILLVDQVVSTMRRNAGKQLDPDLLNLFFEDMDGVLEIYHQFPE
ncbi:hypothetical protein BOW53_01235 [Solemya pervernicosa gill symbiont]|uniref:Response regulatory domain-containing protein n=1 Tax=Solemya pervernicosa gill symbiont TaxID=642797 RepID=A0A1T2LB43_9GAMM|nr:response regulator [Solemya pervernicosa gill symbiont]OOZ42232.1 hypothetical protein BOW53_01235 [Solemya pervernicosa gill symbiont]